MGVLCTWVKLLTDLQIFGCDLYKNAFGGSLRPPSRYKGRQGRKEKEMVENREGRNGREGKDGKG